jgi:hypothetical protein
MNLNLRSSLFQIFIPIREKPDSTSLFYYDLKECRQCVDTYSKVDYYSKVF